MIKLIFTLAFLPLLVHSRSVSDTFRFRIVIAKTPRHFLAINETDNQVMRDHYYSEINFYQWFTPCDIQFEYQPLRCVKVF